MLELSDKLKQAIGNGVRTSLYPFVKIYEGYSIGDVIPDDAESINLSIKETSIASDGNVQYYKPLLLNVPTIKSSAANPLSIINLLVIFISEAFITLKFIFFAKSLVSNE